MTKLLILLVFGLVPFFTFSQLEGDKIIGQYWTDTKEGKVEIFKKDNKYFGKIIWRKDSRLDIENPDKNLQTRSVVGITFMKDFVFENGKWVEGEVYSIENGGTYSGKMWLKNNGKTLKMRGYMGISLFGKTAILSRAE